jgi:phosphoglycolate phosphatase
LFPDVAAAGPAMTERTALVFDLDGTLVDSAPDLLVAVNRLLAEERRRRLALAEVTRMIGDGAQKLVERAFAATGADAPAETLARLTRRFLAHYEGHATEFTRPYAGVPETLARLAAAGFGLAICTNKPEAPTREVLRGLALDHFFAAVFGGDSLPGVRKPDPRLLLATVRALGAEPGQAVMVGDNANDVQAARAAGLAVILRAGGYTSVPATELGADAVIRAFSELPAALSALA